MQTKQNNLAQEIWQKIDDSQQILINMDSRMDPDNISSAKILQSIIQRKFAKTADIIFGNTISSSMQDFVDFSDIKQETDITQFDYSNYDLLIFVDSGTAEHVSQTGEFAIPTDITTINFDHHEVNGLYGQLNYVENIISCSLVLYKFFKELNIELTEHELELVLLGMLTDSVFLMASNVSSTELRYFAEIYDKGVKYQDVYNKLVGSENIHTMRLKAIVYSNLTLLPNIRSAYTTVSLDEINKYKVNLQEAQIRHSQLIRRLEGTDFVFAISQKNKNRGEYDISFRSGTDDFNVLEIAELFGGGGHKGAAGAKLMDMESMDAAVKHTISTISEFLAKK